VAAAAVLAVVVASHTDPSSIGGPATGDASRAPELSGAEGWLNTDGGGAPTLTGNVVVYDFWTYSCVNCIRAAPHLESWYQRYRDDGLVVVGVHSPEFTFERERSNVERAVKELAISYPVALDPAHEIWDAFGAQFWPMSFIHDRAGREVEVRIGEGGYADTEKLLRELLDVRPDSPYAVAEPGRGGQLGGDVRTGETYLGAERGSSGFASIEPLEFGVGSYTEPPTMYLNQHAFAGRWLITDEYAEAFGGESTVSMTYFAAQVNLVMGTSDDRTHTVKIQIDDRPPTTLDMRRPGMQVLVSDESSDFRTIRVTAMEPGLRVYAFTFGG
jgi:thiol-disulfide isomerase/thioredoxin